MVIFTTKKFVHFPDKQSLLGYLRFYSSVNFETKSTPVLYVNAKKFFPGSPGKGSMKGAGPVQVIIKDSPVILAQVNMSFQLR